MYVTEGSQKGISQGGHVMGGFSKVRILTISKQSHPSLQG